MTDIINSNKQTFSKKDNSIKLPTSSHCLIDETITYKLGPFSSWPAMRRDTPNGRDCQRKKKWWMLKYIYHDLLQQEHCYLEFCTKENFLLACATEPVNLNSEAPYMKNYTFNYCAFNNWCNMRISVHSEFFR